MDAKLLFIPTSKSEIVQTGKLQPIESPCSPNINEEESSRSDTLDLRWWQGQACKNDKLHAYVTVEDW